MLKSKQTLYPLTRLHGIPLWYSMEVFEDAYDIYWLKFPLLKKLMGAHPDVDWFMVTELLVSFPDRSSDSIPSLTALASHCGTSLLLYRRPDALTFVSNLVKLPLKRLKMENGVKWAVSLLVLGDRLLILSVTPHNSSTTNLLKKSNMATSILETWFLICFHFRTRSGCMLWAVAGTCLTSDLACSGSTATPFSRT
jgi:hypothetical protein